MNYSLGNMLGGAGALNADKLSLDLQFAADKTLTARKGPTPTFTRASGATEVGSDGLIRYAPENLLLQSETLGTTWATGNLNVTGSPAYLDVATSPIGTVTADKLIANAVNSTHQFRQDVTLVGGSIYTLSVYYKAQEVSFASIAAFGVANGSTDWMSLFDISESTPTAGGFNGFSSTSINSIGNGWFRCSVTFTAVASGILSVRLGGASSISAGAQFYSGNSTSGFLVWGAQLERHTSARAYIPTTTAAVFAARFDHDPVTLACKGLLIEESRTNLVLQSEGFSTASWQKSGSTITADSIASPNGTVTADLLVEDVGLSSHIVQQSAPSLTAGQSYSFSVFAKAGSHTSFQMALSNTAFGGGLFANFVLTGSGSVGTSSGLTTSIQSYPDGWYRCSIAIASVVGGAGGFATIVANANNSSATRLPSYLGTGAQVVHLWGAQLEAGSFPTSYIPTVASSVVRSADLCTITGAAFTGFYNQSEGTVDISASTANVGNAVMLFAFSDGTTNNFTQSLPGTSSLVVNTLNSIQANLNAGNFTTNVVSRLASAFKLNDFAVTRNGGTVFTDNAGTLPTVNQIGIGSRISTVQLNGHIQYLRYYKKRLSNAKLQTLTTL